MTLPTFDGEKDKTLGREMLAAVEGPNGIRTRISSKTMLRTRNGMPEFTTVTAGDNQGEDLALILSPVLRRTAPNPLAARWAGVA
ncbi:hypothetical protein [Candidatus Accumulibacter vicinus]|nr:hypothetical protein [Candidatus Accumulibacter vicinus]